MESLDIQDIQENIQEEKTPLEKAKKPRSDKQMENFKKLQEKRKEAIEKKKLEKKIEASKLLLELEQMTTSPPVIRPSGTSREGDVPKKNKQPSPPPSEDEDDDNSSVEKIIVNVKNKKKAKKKAKEIIIYKDDDSDTEEEEEEEQEYKQPKRALKTQQNKRSKTKVYQQERERPLTETGGLQPQIFKSQSMNYFVD
jgi:hypothetical protein